MNAETSSKKIDTDSIFALLDKSHDTTVLCSWIGAILGLCLAIYWCGGKWNSLFFGAFWGSAIAGLIGFIWLNGLRSSWYLAIASSIYLISWYTPSPPSDSTKPRLFFSSLGFVMVTLATAFYADNKLLGFLGFIASFPLALPISIAMGPSLLLVFLGGVTVGELAHFYKVSQPLGMVLGCTILPLLGKLIGRLIQDVRQFFVK